MSRTPANGHKLIAETGIPECPIFATVEAAVKAPGVDAVIITTPSGAHVEPALTAAAAGKHVVVEKPLEITGPRCQTIIDACDKAKVQLCTIFPSRFADSNVTLKAAVDAGKFGRLTLGEASNKWWRSQAYYDEGGWKGTQALDGGGAIMNQAIHNVDLLLWMMGPAARLRSDRDARSRTHRGRRHGRCRDSVPQWGVGLPHGDDERSSGVSEANRDSRRQGFGCHRARRCLEVGLQPADVDG